MQAGLGSDDNSLLPQGISGHDAAESQQNAHEGRKDRIGSGVGGGLRSTTTNSSSNNNNNNHNGNSSDDGNSRNSNNSSGNLETFGESGRVEKTPRSPSGCESSSLRSGERERRSPVVQNRAGSHGPQSPTNGDTSSPTGSAGVNGRQGEDHIDDDMDQDDELVLEEDDKNVDGDIASPPRTRASRRGVKRTAECQEANVDDQAEDSLDGVAEGPRGTRAASRKGVRRRMPAPPRHPDGDSSSEQLVICTNGVDGDEDDETSQRHSDL